MEVTLQQILEVREQRSRRQTQLIREFGRPLVSFSMNIPGPVKDSPIIRRGFRAGCKALEAELCEAVLLFREISEAATGCEAFYVVDMDPLALKARTAAIEDHHPLGRLLDLDVIGPDLCKLDREAVGGGSRNCLVCGAPGRGCASRRLHTVAQLQGAVSRILSGYFLREDARNLGDLAVRSLLDEVETTPKPGLVDRRNSGSHRDMDISTFRTSAASLAPYFHRCAAIGMETREETAEATFPLLRQAGLEAEQVMYRATKGINTHKGAIFTMGLLCGAAGRLWNGEGTWDPEALCREVSAMTAKAMEEDRKKPGNTAGARLYAQLGIRGIRGEAAMGLPSVSGLGLPLYRQLRAGGMDRNEAGVRTLLQLIARVEDTNMIARGGLSGAKAGAAACAELLAREYTLADVEALDDWFIAQNLSPGGCADLLAAIYFLYGLIS